MAAPSRKSALPRSAAGSGADPAAGAGSLPLDVASGTPEVEARETLRQERELERIGSS